MKISKRVKNYPRGFHERQAVRDRLPGWAKLAQFLIQFICWPVLGLSWFFLFAALYHQLHSTPHAAPMISSCAGVIAFSALFGTLPLALMVTNLVLWIIPPLRRANEIAAQNVSGATFKTATEDLFSIAKIFIPIAVVASIVGAWGPWI